MNYNIDYFIAKFEAIPEEKWFIGALNNHDWTRFCALGFCCETVFPYKDSICAKYLQQGDEARALLELTGINQPSVPTISMINDGWSHIYQEATPKERVLAALYDLKAAEAIKQAEAIIQNPVEMFAV